MKSQNNFKIPGILLYVNTRNLDKFKYFLVCQQFSVTNWKLYVVIKRQMKKIPVNNIIYYIIYIIYIREWRSHSLWYLNLFKSDMKTNNEAADWGLFMWKYWTK